nr:hypothetical protein [Tanacetum cinerariifolium]
MDIEADEEEEEEHPTLAGSVVVALRAADQAPSAKETESFETDESIATPPPHPAYQYVPESDLKAHPEEDDDEDPEEDPEGLSEDDKDDDMDIEADEEEEEEHPALAGSVVVALPAADQAPSAKETESFETDEFIATPPPHPAYRMTVRISILAPVPVPACPIRSLGYRAAMIRLRAEAASTSHSPPLPPDQMHLHQGYHHPYLYQLLLYHRHCNYPLLVAGRTDPREIRRDPQREVGYGITDSWDEIAETLQGAPSERQLLAGRLNMLFQERRAHTYTRHLMETEARLSREAWVRSIDSSDLTRGEAMSLCTTVLGQTTETRELHATDRRRQIVTSVMRRADHMRFAEIRGLRTADRTRQQQLI